MLTPTRSALLFLLLGCGATRSVGPADAGGPSAEDSGSPHADSGDSGSPSADSGAPADADASVSAGDATAPCGTGSCSPSTQYCLNTCGPSANTFQCEPLPASCGEKPTCACITSDFDAAGGTITCTADEGLIFASVSNFCP
jgi:hypothetical protein